MRTGRFHHKVEIEIELTGLDLAVLEHHARAHYDHTCKKFFDVKQQGDTRNNKGCVWKHAWQFKDWEGRFGQLEDKMVEDGELRHPAEDPELAIVEVVDSRTLDLCMKILERLEVDESWEFIEELTGKKMPSLERTLDQLARELRSKIRQAFFQIQKEWKRLDEAAGSSLEDELEEAG